MVDVSSSNNKKINITVSAIGNKGNVSVTPDTAMYYSNKSKEWAISDKLIDNEDYSSKYYANESKKQADISTAKTVEVVESGNTAVSNIESARDNAITDITNQESLSVDNVNTAGATQVSSVNTAGITQVTNVNSAGTTQINLAKEQVTLATNQANIATNKTSEVVASGNTALSNITTAKNNAITSITNQESTSKNNVIATGNAQVERVNLTGVDNRTPIFSKSEVGTNEGVYQNVYDLKHSTFDLSKFTVVGSPTITDDGIASGFSSTNYIKHSLSIPVNSKIECIIKVQDVTNTTDARDVFSLRSGTTCLLNARMSISGQSITLIYADSATTRNSKLMSYNYRQNPSYIKVSYYNGTADIYSGLDIDSLTLLDTITGIYDLAIDSISIGCAYVYGSMPFTNGSIDLKQFSITVDGKEVFSGNKTGIDVIKPDNYEIVGSPIITDDGVVSGFSNSNYISISPVIQLGNYNTWEIITPKFIINEVTTHHQVIFWTEYNTWYGGIRILRSSINGKINIQLASTSSTDNDIGTILFDTALPLNKTYQIKLKFTGTQYIAYLREGDGDWQQAGTPIETTTKIYNALNSMYLGGINSADWYLNGSIDLNAFKIYVDGNLVYQPCLKIPYTQSKTGSKIVDSVYRDRVIDLYEQEGQTGYYTIDEENQNFTLPMGEIYGMIEDKANKATVEESLASKVDFNAPQIQAPYLKTTYVNGTSGYRIWSNGYCEQWGEVPYGLDVDYTGTLLKSYSNTNYQVEFTTLANNTSATATQWQFMAIYPITNSTFGCKAINFERSWRAYGYLAQGEY